MLLSRFWYLFLSLCAAGAVGAAMLAQGIINNRSDEALQEALRRDRQLAREIIRLEARARIDKLAFAGVDNEFGSLLRRAKGVTDERKLAEIAAEAKKRMARQASSIAEAAKGATAADAGRKPDIAFGLDADGRIIAQLGPMTANPPGSSLASHPLVKKALGGYLRDDIWLYDRKLYRMAARPVVSGGGYVGAILHGYKLTPKFAEEISTVLGGPTVGFFHGKNVFSLYPGEAEAASQGELAAALEEVLQDPEFADSGRADNVVLENGSSAAIELLAGSTAPIDVGLVIARPRSQIESPMALFDSATEQDVAALPKPLLAIGALIAAALGLLFMFLERDKPLKALKDKVASIGTGETERLVVTEWRGGYRNFALAINEAIDKEVERAVEKGPRSKKKANLDELLGPAPGDSQPDAFFGFASDGASSPGAAPSAPGAPPPLSGAGGQPPAAPAQTGPVALQPAPAPPAAAPAPPAPPRPGPPAAAPPAAPPAPPAPSPTTSAAAGAGNGSASDEATHFRETYDQYIATRKECGEPTESLTFEKFSVTLNKTRDQIISKHGGSSVRFTVYVKAGKAALKAAPVK